MVATSTRARFCFASVPVGSKELDHAACHDGRRRYRSPIGNSSSVHAMQGEEETMASSSFITTDGYQPLLLLVMGSSSGLDSRATTPSIHPRVHARTGARFWILHLGSCSLASASPSIRRDSIHASTTGQAGDKGAEEREPGRPSSMHAPPPFRACQPMQTKGDPIDQSV